MADMEVNVPDGWQAIELGKLLLERKKSGLKVSDAANFGQYPFFTSGEAVLQHNAKQVDGDNIYLATGGVANIKYFSGEAAYSTDTYAISASKEVETEYLYFNLLNVLYYINANYFQGSGLKHLQKKDFKKHPILYPEQPAEQRQIARILSKVDEAISQTEQLIAKYRRLKTGLMQDLLTKGIDEHGNIRSEETHAFKDSPLGRIPAEWEVEKLNKLCSDIVDCPHSTPAYLEEGVLVARTMHIKNGRYNVANSSFVSEDEYLHRILRNKPSVGDIIFTREAPVGEAFVIPEGMKICLGQRVMLVRVNDNIKSNFLLELIYSDENRIIFDNMVSGTTNPHLNVKDVRELFFKVPEVDEQKRIMALILKQRSGLDSFRHNLAKLQSLKTGLMQDLLSGEVRVSQPIAEQAEA